MLSLNSANKTNLITLQEELSEDFYNNTIDYKKLKISLRILYVFLIFNSNQILSQEIFKN